MLIALGIAAGAAVGCRRHAHPPNLPPTPVTALGLPTRVPGGTRPDAGDSAHAHPTVIARPIGDTPSCALWGDAIVLGHAAEVTSLTMSVFPHEGGPVCGVAWVVPPLFGHGPDDTAAVRFSSVRGDILHIDPEEPSDARGLVVSPVAIARAFLRPSAVGFTVDSDRISRDDDGNAIVECGDLSAQMATVDPTTVDGVARNVSAGAMFFCRTAYNVVQPFVLGLRGVEALAVLRTARFFATRGTAVPNPAADFWTLPVDPTVGHARDPAAALRDASPEGLDVAELPGVGYAVTSGTSTACGLAGWGPRSVRWENCGPLVRRAASPVAPVWLPTVRGPWWSLPTAPRPSPARLQHGTDCTPWSHPQAATRRPRLPWPPSRRIPCRAPWRPLRPPSWPWRTARGS